MAIESSQLLAPVTEYWAALLGLIIVTVYAWDRFNEPTFPNRDTLPRTVAPLRYLFLRSAYRRARLCYVVVSLLLYGILVWPGASILDVFGVKSENFPPQAWALLVALVLVGILPNVRIAWLTRIEEQLRRWVHEWFLVPDGTKEIINTLNNSYFEIHSSQLDALPDALKDNIYPDLRLPRNTLRYRWARAAILMETLRQIQIGASPSQSLQRVAFDPFQEDYEAIRDKYRVLEKEIGQLGANYSVEREESLGVSVDYLLNRIYAYLSWGIRHQADSDREVARMMEELGFRIPRREGRQLSDVMVPATLLIAVITMGFWLTVDGLSGRLGAQSVLLALTSAMAASIMYGRAIYIGLNQRSSQIEASTWNQTSPADYISMAYKSGLVAWIVIVLTTVIWSIPETLASLAALVGAVKSVALGTLSADEDWKFLPIRLLSAAPWMIAGATASVLLAWRIRGDVRRADRSRQAIDVAVIGLGLGVAAAVAQLIQASLAELVRETDKAEFGLVPIIGMAGFACGAVIGLFVPRAWRAGVVHPRDLRVASDLKNLLRAAEAKRGTRTEAENWVFSPHPMLGEITPAEALQYRAHAAGVPRLLESESAQDSGRSEPSRQDRPTPIVIEGGRGSV